jgi:hypothetical protein
VSYHFAVAGIHRRAESRAIAWPPFLVARLLLSLAIAALGGYALTSATTGLQTTFVVLYTFACISAFTSMWLASKTPAGRWLQAGRWGVVAGCATLMPRWPAWQTGPLHTLVMTVHWLDYAAVACVGVGVGLWVAGFVAGRRGVTAPKHHGQL